MMLIALPAMTGVMWCRRSVDLRDLVIIAIVGTQESFHVAFLEGDEIGSLSFQAAVAAATATWLGDVQWLGQQEALRLSD